MEGWIIFEVAKFFKGSCMRSYLLGGVMLVVFIENLFFGMLGEVIYVKEFYFRFMKLFEDVIGEVSYGEILKE